MDALQQHRAQAKQQLYLWHSQHLVSWAAWRNALGLLPSPGAKQSLSFFNPLLLGSAALCFASALICFFAYNWAALPRMGKLALLETGLLGCLLLAFALSRWLKPLLADKAQGALPWLLFVACVFIGVLLAFIGQSYQQGADNWQLFAVWALLILPWVVFLKLEAGYLLLILLLNLALCLLLQITSLPFADLFSFLGDDRLAIPWSLFALNWLLHQCLLRFALTDKHGIPLSEVTSGLLSWGFLLLASCWTLFDSLSKEQFIAVVLYGVVAAALIRGYHTRRKLYGMALGFFGTAALFDLWLLRLLSEVLDGDAVVLLFALMTLCVLLSASVVALLLKRLQADYLATAPEQQAKQHQDATADTEPREDEQIVPNAGSLFWQRLQQAGIVSGDVTQETPELQSPWYLKAMLILFGWLAGICLLGFIGTSLALLLDDIQPGLLLSLALAASAVAFGLSRGQSGLFISQFALSFAVAALVLYGIAFDELLFEVASWRWWLMLALAASLHWYLLPPYLTRSSCALLALLALIALLQTLALLPLVTPALLLGFVLLWRHEADWGKTPLRWRSLAMALTLALLFCQTPQLVWLEGVWELKDPGVSLAMLQGAQWLLEALLLWQLWCLFGSRMNAIRHQLDGRSQMLLLLGLLSALVWFWWIPGLIAGALVAVFGFVLAERLLLCLGVLAMPVYCGYYYYSLQQTLLEKSLLLMLLGVSLLLLWFALKPLSDRPEWLAAQNGGEQS